MMCTSPSAAPALPSLPHHWKLGLKGLVLVLYPTAGAWGRSDTQERGLSRAEFAWLPARTGDAGPPPPLPQLPVPHRVLCSQVWMPAR